MNTQNQIRSRRLVIAAALGSLIGLSALGVAHFGSSHAAEPIRHAHFVRDHHGDHSHRMHRRMHRQDFGEHIEGRLAFLKTELLITESQNKVWEEFANTLRAYAKEAQARRDEMRARIKNRNRSDGERRTVIERLENSEQRLSEALTRQQKLRAAIEPLYAALSDNQKELADKLLHFGARKRG